MVSCQKIEDARAAALLTSLYSLVFHGGSFDVCIDPLLMKCHLSQDNPVLLGQPSYEVQSRVSIDSFPTFARMIGGTERAITDENVSDLGLLSNELKIAALSTAVADCREECPSQYAGMRLITVSLGGWLQSHDRAIRLLEERVGRRHQAAIAGERAKVTKAGKDMELAAEQRRHRGARCGHVMIGKIQFRNDRLYLSAWEIFRSRAELRPAPAAAALIWSPR
jgi:hypothetical protein